MKVVQEIPTVRVHKFGEGFWAMPLAYEDIPYAEKIKGVKNTGRMIGMALNTSIDRKAIWGRLYVFTHSNLNGGVWELGRQVTEVPRNGWMAAMIEVIR